MENKSTTRAAENVGGKKQYGKVVDNRHKLFFTMSVGEGSFDLDGATVKFELMANIGSGAPLVKFGNRTFVLSWDDIIELAEQAGLFNDEGEVSE